MGAVIKMKSSIPSRRALLYIGAMGPLPGFLVSLLAVIIGISNSSIVSVANFDSSQIAVGESLLFSMIVKLIHGTIPAGCDLLLSPIAWAGWVGFFVTSLNLLPIGQLDGGHILYGLLGKKQVYAGWLAFFILVFFSFKWFGWVIWIFLSMTILMIAHPEIPEGEKPSILEKAMGYFCVIILIVTFMPVPIKLP
jgi:membrane-associated protease RseP (regulator of RpoE activity)